VISLIEFYFLIDLIPKEISGEKRSDFIVSWLEIRDWC
jgi:hypothetical protein